MSALEGPFEAIKDPIQLTEALFPPRRALICVDLGGPLSALKGLFRPKRALFLSKRALFLPKRSLCWPEIFLCWPDKGLLKADERPFAAD